MDDKAGWDKVVFLLSADWIVPFLPALGLSFSAQAAVRVQEAARKLTREIVGPSGVYWNANFADARIATAKSRLISELRNEELSDDWIVDIASFGARLVEKRSIGSDEPSTWICHMLLQQLGARPVTEPPPHGVSADLVSQLREAIADTQSSLEVQRLEEALLKSSTYGTFI